MTRKEWKKLTSKKSSIDPEQACQVRVEQMERELKLLAQVESAESFLKSHPRKRTGASDESQ